MLITTVFSQRGTRRFEASVRTATSNGRILIIRTTSSRNYRPASGASFRSGHTNAVALFKQLASPSSAPSSPPSVRRSRPTRRRPRGPARRAPSCTWSTPDPHSEPFSPGRPRTGQDRRDGAEESGAKRGVRPLCAPPPPRAHPSRTVAPVLAPEPSVPVRRAH